MTRTVERLMVGIFGPSDCKPEKECLRRLIADDQVLRRIANELGLVLQYCSGDDVTSGPGRPQARINKYIEEMNPDLSIFVFKQSFGSEAGQGRTGTEEEWEIAVRANPTKDTDSFGLYFAKSDSTDPRLADFRAGIKRDFVAFYNEFENLTDFAELLRWKLTDFVYKQAEIRKDTSAFVISTAIGALSNSPYSLATYPRSLPDGEELPRAEIDALLERIAGNEFSSTVILGDRGSGKSALLATLESRLRERNIAVLAIKADMLGVNVCDEATLDHALQLPLGLAAAVRMVAASQPIVVLIDQLDALADILDRKTERLNVLLNAIRSVSNVINVHLIVSSRPFEYHHDARLRAMSAQRLDLQLPPWDDVATILEKHGYNAEQINDSVRQLLRNPWTLNTFLGLRPKEVGFQSLFGLLEEVWAKTVEAPTAPPGTRELVATFVEAMSNDEVLWVARSIASGYELAREYLIDQDVIQQDDTKLRIAFRHQSFFEFALVRRFAAGDQNFAAYVLDRSNGLFIRPVALAGLAYLRGTVPLRYETELRALWTAQPRPHLGALIVDFVAAQGAPLPTEIAIVTEMLGNDQAGQRALAAIAATSSWLPILRPTAAFIAWLRKPPAAAVHVTRLLADRASKAPEEALEVIEREWIRNPDYDRLAFSVLRQLSPWTEHALQLLLLIVNRSRQEGVYDLAVQLIEQAPAFAARLLRAELDRRLNEVIACDTNEQALEAALESLLSDDEHSGVFEELAKSAPDEVVTYLLPWVAGLLERTTGTTQNYQRYNHTSIELTSYGSLPIAALIEATIRAVERVAATTPDVALAALEPHLKSASMGVHTLIAHAMQCMAAGRPSIVASFLLEDPRRLAIGTWARAHQYSKRVISAVIPHLTETTRRDLERSILAYEYYLAPDEELTPERQAQKPAWNREHRLFLLQSFPDEHLSPDGLAIKRQLDAEFPGIDESMFGEIRGGFVGPLFDRAALESQTDAEIVAVFEELTDDTRWDHPQRWSVGDRLVGGAIQQAHVIAELAELDPERVFRLATQFRPNDQEQPVSEAIRGLSKSNFDPERLLSLILGRTAAGFKSEAFITAAAQALTTVAEKRAGLPDEAIALLRLWLDEIAAPSSGESEEAESERPQRPLVLGPGTFFLESGSRESIIEAIAAGYLERNPPEIAPWVSFVRERIGVERDTDIWLITIRELQSVLREDQAAGTALLSAIFKQHPEVLCKPLTWVLIANWMRAIDPAPTVREWLQQLGEFGDARSLQAKGELLYLYAVIHPASHVVIQDCLHRKNARDEIRGFAFAAAHLWSDTSTRPLGLEVFVTQIERWPMDAAQTLSSLLAAQREELELDEPTQTLLRKAATNASILLHIFPELGEELERHTTAEPALVADIACAFINAPTDQVAGTLLPVHRGIVSDVITSISLTLHRLPAYSAIGLDLFEKLLAANVREAQVAAEMLDRKPSRYVPTRARRRRTRKRR